MSIERMRVQVEGSPAFEGWADREDRWNGFLKPRFTLDEVRKIAAWTQENNGKEGGCDVVHVIDTPVPVYGEDDSQSVGRFSVVLMVNGEMSWADKESDHTSVIDHDRSGTYDIGGGGWTWTEFQIPTRPVEELEKVAGRYVPYDGEYVVFGQTPAKKLSSFYYSFSLGMDEDDAVALIQDLPIHLVLNGQDMEHGLVDATPYEDHANSAWYVAEAFCRLGVLPPAEELALGMWNANIKLTSARMAYILDAVQRSHDLHAKYMETKASKLAELRSVVSQ